MMNWPLKVVSSSVRGTAPGVDIASRRPHQYIATVEGEYARLIHQKIAIREAVDAPIALNNDTEIPGGFRDTRGHRDTGIDQSAGSQQVDIAAIQRRYAAQE